VSISSKRVRFMRAIMMPRFGGPELFEERDVEGLEPGPGEVLGKVVVAGTKPVDTKLRADGSFAALEPPVVLGSDASGVVEEVGAGVADLAPGDEVYYTPEIFGPGSNGGYAEYNLVGAETVAKKPASLSHVEA
jgi:NADPH:quinone reductase